MLWKSAMSAASVAALALFLAGCGHPAYQVFAVRVASAPPAKGIAGETAETAPVAAVSGQATEDGKLDLNHATATELRRLPGAGPTVIAAILAGRPYTAKQQLVKRGVLSAAQYASWKEYLVVHRTTAARTPEH